MDWGADILQSSRVFLFFYNQNWAQTICIDYNISTGCFSNKNINIKLELSCLRTRHSSETAEECRAGHTLKMSQDSSKGWGKGKKTEKEERGGKSWGTEKLKRNKPRGKDEGAMQLSVLSAADEAAKDHCTVLYINTHTHTQIDLVAFTEGDPLRKHRGRNIPNKAFHCVCL